MSHTTNTRFWAQRPRFMRVLWVVPLAALALAWTGLSSAADPIQKALDAIGGEDALRAFDGFAYEATGHYDEPQQGPEPDQAIRSSTFSLDLRYDVRGDRLSLAWRRQVLDPVRGSVEYRDILAGGAGYQTGRGNLFLPPDAKTDGPLTPMRVGAIEHEMRLLNPHLLLKSIAGNRALVTAVADEVLRGRTFHVIEVVDEVALVRLYVDERTGRISRLKTIQNDHIWGDVEAGIVYGDWRTAAGSRLVFPHRVEIVVDGHTLRTEQRGRVTVNPGFAADLFDIPLEARRNTDPAAVRQGAVHWLYIARWHGMGLPFGDEDQIRVVSETVLGDENIRHLTGAFHHSLAVRLNDGIVVVEAPLNEARSNAVLAEIDRVWPGVPVTHLVVTHHHFDHLGGFRTYAAAGATIVTSELNRSYVERALASTHSLAPDALAAVASPTWRLESVPADGAIVLNDGHRSIELRHVQTRHSSDMLIVHLPESRVVFASDLYHAGLMPPEMPMPAPFDTLAGNLRDGLDALGWDVRWIVGGHGASPGLGGVRPISDLHAHAGAAG